jgi:hypothetical protein
MTFNTEKNKLNKSWDQSSNNKNQLENIKNSYDLTRSRIADINRSISVIEKFIKAEENFTNMQDPKIGHLQHDTTTDRYVNYIGWDIELGSLDIRLLPYLNVEIIAQVPGNIEMQTFFPSTGYKGYYYEIKEVVGEESEGFVKEVILHASLYFVPFAFNTLIDPTPLQAKLLLSLSNINRFR